MAEDVGALLKEYAELSRLPPAKDTITRLNKVKELLGEAGAKAKLAETYGPGRIRFVDVPVRGTKGPPVLDILYELDSGELILVESKYGESLLGRTLDKRVYRVGVSQGKVVKTPLPLQRQVEQLDAKWVKDRIAEIEKKDPELARRLRAAVEKDQLKILEVRTEVDETGAKLTSTVTEHTEQFREQMRSGRRLADEERRYARREALGAEQVESLTARAKREAKAAQAAEREAKKADKAVAAAKKDLDAAKKPATKLKRQAIVAEKEKAAKELNAAAAEARKTADATEELRKTAQRAKQADTAKRKALEAEKRLEATKQLQAAKELEAAKQLEASRAVADTRKAVAASADEAIGSRLAENRLGAPVAKDVLVRTGEKVTAEAAAETAAKASRTRALLEFAGKGLRLTSRVGRVAFVILDLANPIFDILLAVELVDALVNWLRRDQIKEEEEWRNLNDYFLGERNRVVTKYGMIYWSSVRPFVNALLEVRLADDSYSRNFLYWLGLWNGSRTPGSFAGFVYSQIDADMERQEASTSAEETESEPGVFARAARAATTGAALSPPSTRASRTVSYPVKYYDAENLRLSFTAAPEPNKRVVTKTIGWVGPQDPRNRSTGGGEARYDPDFNISVCINFQSVRFTPPQPTLTPFDFMIVKCRHLVSEIVSFISRYEPSVVEGMEIRTEILDPGKIFKGEKIYWLEGQTFAAPLDSDEIHFCIKTIFWAVDMLETAAIRDGDFGKVKDGDDRFNRGFYRRLKVMGVLNSRYGGDPRGAEPIYKVRPMADVSRHLWGIAFKRKDVRSDDLEYLSTLASSIDDDLVAVYKAMRSTPGSLEYNYQGKPAKPSGG